jgi:hypothetical protein
MFQWDKSIKILDVPVGKVVHLFRSMRDVQLALPGLPAQEASAYLCQYQTAQGAGTAAVFHLHKSCQLAFYVNTPREVALAKAEAMLDQALTFVESMGFLLTDLDIHLLTDADREMLWASLPLQKGVVAAEKSLPSKPRPVEPTPPQPKTAALPATPEPLQVTPAIVTVPNVPLAEAAPTAAASERPPEGPSAEADKSEATDVDELLAAVEGLRTRRPGVRTRKRPPSPEELKRRRQELRENLGRVLASL